MFYIGSKSGEPQVSAYESMRRECEELLQYCRSKMSVLTKPKQAVESRHKRKH